MQRAETLQALIRERGKQGKPVERVYRMLFNPDLYLIAYAKLSGNEGALTPGITGDTVDGMSMDKIKAIIERLRHERYRWSPVRRVYIPKKNGKKRPLGIPPWSDKLLQEVMRMILSAYYEPKFADNSHGFREGRGPHTALGDIREKWAGTSWFLEGDIKGCYDHVDHQVLLDILARDIRDNRFLRLVKYLLEAGYMEDWRYHSTYSGTPQGGVVSPLLANVYLNELDQYVNQTLTPKWTKGNSRRRSTEYYRLKRQEEQLRKKGRNEEAKAIRKESQKRPSVDTKDEGYRRLRYVRYADDYLLSFVGSKAEAEEIKEVLGTFLREHLKLEQSPEKTLVTHARTERARFLGYEVHTAQLDFRRSRSVGTSAHDRRSTNGRILLNVPETVLRDKCQHHLKNGKTIHRTERLEDDDFTIVATYQSEYRGLVNYYALAYDLRRLGKLRWIMEQALTKTLARKHKTSVKRIYAKYAERREADGRRILVVRKPRDGKEPLVATWGGISLQWNPNAIIVDRERRIWNHKTELLQRLMANECEYCGSTEDIEVHHIRRVISDKEKGWIPIWLKIMRARRRKTMVLCHDCHTDITFGRPMRNVPSGYGFMWTGQINSTLRKIINGTGEPDAVKSCTSGSEGGSRKSATGIGPEE
jgi:group II intron reverse transcriptase/maturase